MKLKQESAIVQVTKDREERRKESKVWRARELNQTRLCKRYKLCPLSLNEQTIKKSKQRKLIYHLTCDNADRHTM